jgi:16S rRNA (cytosine967-C5)-methyltransferase
MQLAAAGHAVTAVDRSESRLARLKENLARTELAADLVAADALTWSPPQEFDAILLDAPCSATGTFRRHPEVLYRARPSVIADSAELQARLLDRASAMLKSGGVLVYAVCSLEPAEGEEVIAAFLDRAPRFQVAPPVAGELPDGVTSSPPGWVRVLPGMLEPAGGLDGFFVVRLRSS